jgi:hypothetical protein
MGKQTQARTESKLVERPQVAVRTTFQVDEINVIGNEEKRFADDFEDVHLRGKIEEPASVSLGFTQAISLQTMLPVAEGQIAPAMVKAAISEHVAEGIGPDAAIALGEYLIEEGKRVKETMKEQPLQSDLVMAISDGDVEAVAKRIDSVRKIS